MRLALLGCGRIARLAHLEVLRRLPHAQVVALAETDAGRLAAAAAQVPGAVALTDYREAIASAAVDAVVITLPPALHAEAALAAFTAGCHVYLEKPLAATLEEARPLLEAWHASGLIGMIGFNYRFHPAIAAAKRVLASGRLGELVAVRSVFAAAAREQPVWKHARTTGGGTLLDLASHHVDLVRFFLDEPIVEATATLRSVRTEGDTALLRLTLASGVPVQSFFSMVASAEDRWEFFGTAAKLSLDRYASEVRIHATALSGRAARLTAAAIEAVRLIRLAGRSAHEPSYGAALARFVDAVRTGKPATPDFADGYRSLEVIAGAEAAADREAAWTPLAGESLERRA